MSIILRSLTMMHEMVCAQRRLCSLIVLWPMKKKKDELLQQQNDNINSLENSLKIKTSNYRRLISYKRQERERAVWVQGPTKRKRFVERQKKQDEMMKEFAKKKKDNLDQLKTFQKTN
jgi:hypothetical protein